MEIKDFREQFLDDIIDICELGISREEKHEKVWIIVHRAILQATGRFMRTVLGEE